MISWFMPPSPYIWVIIMTRHVDMLSCHDHYAKECHNTGSRVVDAAWWYDLWPSSILETTINLLFSTSIPVMKWKCELKSNIFLTLFDRIMMRWRLHTDWMMQNEITRKDYPLQHCYWFTSSNLHSRTYHLQSLLKELHHHNKHSLVKTNTKRLTENTHYLLTLHRTSYNWLLNVIRTFQR